jgi:hypothetical protein
MIMAKTKDKKPKKAPAEKAVGVKAARSEPEKKKAGRPPKEERKVSEEELAALRTPVEEAKAKLEEARKEADALEAKAKAVLAESKEAYRAALAPYREACRKAKVACEFEGGRTANVSEKVSFLVEKTEKGVRIMIKDRPKTEEVIPVAVLKKAPAQAAYGYTERHLGPRAEIGNKGGSLYNRLRAVMA